MGSGLKAQNITGIRAHRKGLRAQKNGIRDHKVFEPESGIRFITQSKNLLSQYFSSSETKGQSVGSRENFRRAYSLDPTDCPWVSEDEYFSAS